MPADPPTDLPTAPATDAAPGAPARARTRLLDAAQTLFARRGFGATSTRSIAEEAGCATGLLFYYFGSKREIFDALVEERTLETEIRDVLAAAPRGDPHGAMAALALRLLRTLEQRRDLVRILFQELAAAPAEARLPRIVEREVDLLRGYLDGAGPIRLDAGALARTLLAAVIFHVLLARDRQPEAFALDVARLLLCRRTAAPQGAANVSGRDTLPPRGTVSEKPARTSKRERILDAAQKLFAARGFDATTTKAISDEAGVAAGLLFYHFDSKEELLETLIGERTLAADLPAILEASMQRDPYATLVALGLRVLRTLEERDEMVRILLREVVVSDPGVDRTPHLSALFRNARSTIATYLDGAVADERLEPVDTEVLAETYVAALLFHALFTDAAGPETFVLKTVDLLLPGARRTRPVGAS